jgi:hypothetical protein
VDENPVGMRVGLGRAVEVRRLPGVAVPARGVGGGTP